jgi:ribosomal-protein-alanine N-acetyltransferase
MELKSLLTPFPTLPTPRLWLRALRPADLDDLYAYASDPEIDRYTPWIHYASRDEARADLDHFLAEYERDGLGAWGIEHRASSRLIGIINTSLPHPHHRRVEMGYTIARAEWGQGFASEAAQALTAFCFDRLDLVRVEAVCLPANRASARVLTKIGMQFEGLLRHYQIWRGQPVDLEMYAMVCAPPSR